MNEWSIRVLTREGAAVALPAGVQFRYLRGSATLVGGMETAEIAATADVTLLLQCRAWLGYSVRVHNPDGQEVWWGDIHEVTLDDGLRMRGGTLDGVANRVKLVYTVDAPGGAPTAGETDWVEDAASVARYGVHERRASAGTMTDAQAVQARTTLLGRVARPLCIRAVANHGAIPSSSHSSSGAARPATVTLRCVGWFARLAHAYYINDAGLVEWTAGSGVWPLGLGFVSEAVAFLSSDKKYTLHQLYGRFRHFGQYDGLRMVVSGSNGNDSVYTVKSGDAKEPVAYTSNAIAFEPNDDIRDGNGGLGDFAQGDLIQISGAAHAGTNHVKTATSHHMEVSPGYRGGAIGNEAAGTNVTILRGNKVEVAEVVSNEHAGASITVIAEGREFFQTFSVPSAASWAVDAVEVALRKVGAPSDNVQIRLYTLAGSAPETWIATATVAASSIVGDQEDWFRASFDNKVTLTGGGSYGLLLRRSDSDDSFDYFEVGIDGTGGYTGGALTLWNGSAWVTPAEPKSLRFRVLGAVDTGLQVQEIVQTTAQLAGVLVHDLSGLQTNQWRAGSETAHDEVVRLLDTGVSDGARLLAEVGRTGLLNVRRRPAKATARYIYRDAQNLLDLQGQRVTPGVLPVGEWVHDDDALGVQGAWSDDSPFFCAYASYSPESGWELRAEEQRDPWQLGGVQDG